MIPFTDEEGNAYFHPRLSGKQKCFILAENDQSYKIKFEFNDQIREFDKSEAFRMFYGAEIYN